MIRSQRNIVIPAIMQMRHRAPAAGAILPSWTFTTTCAAGFDPEVVKSGAVATWDLGDGSPLQNTNSVSYSYADSSSKTVLLYVDNVANVTRIVITSDVITSITSFSAFTSLTHFQAGGNATLAFDIASVTYPASLQQYILSSSGASGSIASASWPSGMTIMDLSGTSVTGSIASTTFPAGGGLLTVDLSSSGVTGSIASATWPSSMRNLSANSTAISGSIASTTWPASLLQLQMRSTSVSGDVSAATWPSGLTVVYLWSTSISGDVSAAGWPAGIRDLRLYNNSGISYGGSGAFQSLTWNTVRVEMQNCTLAEAEVDAVLADFVATAITAGYLDLRTNTVPSAAGAANKATLIARGWTVYTD